MPTEHLKSCKTAKSSIWATANGSVTSTRRTFLTVGTPAFFTKRDAAVRRLVYATRRWSSFDRERYCGACDRRRGPLEVFQPKPGHGQDNTKARRAVTAHTRAHARPLIFWRWRDCTPRLSCKLR